MQFDIITIFPDIFDSYFKESFIKRAQKAGLISIRTHNLRNFTNDKHKKVDDRPFGGGPGMVLKVEPIAKTVASLLPKKRSKQKTRTVLFSLRGRKLDAAMAKRLSRYDKIIMICGRYEGVDERVAEHIVDEEISIGDFVLSGGELPALVLLESISRFLPGFLGKQESLEDLKGSYPAYTRPEIYSSKKGSRWPVPKILLSGDHKKIEEWRRQKR